MTNKPDTTNDPRTNLEKTGNALVLFILGLSSVMGCLLVFTLLQIGIPVHPTALAAPQEHMVEAVPDSSTGIGDDTTQHAANQYGKPSTRIMVRLNSFVVSLNEPGDPRYLKITLAIEAPSDLARNEVEQNKAEIRDALIPYFSSLSLQMTKGIRGKQRIRKQAAEQINTVLVNHTINRVFISEFITQ